jgi:hypothetical protein
MQTLSCQLPQRRVWAVAVALVVSVVCLACTWSIAGAATPTRDVYYTSCGLEDKPGKCELRVMPENLAGSRPVSALPAWYAECGPNAGYPATTVAEDGTTAVTLEDISKEPGVDGDTAICRLAVTNLATGESHVLPAYSLQLLDSIKARGWTISPNGQDITIIADNGVDVQNVQTMTPPHLLRTGFTPQGVGWYPDSTRLLVAGPGASLGGRGPVDAANRLFEFALSGQLLGRWLIKSPSTYLLEADFIQVGLAGQVYIGGGASLLPGAQPNMPSGYYLVQLQKHVSIQLITRISQTHYEGVVAAFGVDAERGLLFTSKGKNRLCLVSISRGTQHCVKTPGRGVQLALPANNNSSSSGDLPPVETSLPGSILGPVTGPSGQLTCPPEQTPGIYLCGDSTVSLNTNYTYQLEIVSSASYENAAVWIAIPESDSSQRQVVNLVANQPWYGSFTTKFMTTQELSSSGISVAVVSPPTKQPPYSHTVYSQYFPLTLAAGLQ